VAKGKLAHALMTTKVDYTTTQDKLASKLKELDDEVIREQEANTLREQAAAKLADLETKLATVEGEKKDQGLLLETARQVLSKHEDSSILMISTAVANAMALLKSHLPNLIVELLRKDFAVDEAGREVLTSSTYDAAHESTHLMTCLVVLSPKTMTVLGTCYCSPGCCNRYLLIKIYLTFTKYLLNIDV
jgi:hypothetical protein